VRISRVDLAAFGPFTKTAIDLAAGGEGLHIVYGPNEAGKSSALRALECALFGIPGRCTDNFVHPYADLRIGLKIVARDGCSLEFVRRKAAKNTLLAADASPLRDDALTPFLGAIDRDLFTTMFGIGHEQLVRGGREIVTGSGSVGQLLFAAGAGIAELQAVQAKIDQQAASLFAARAKNPVINQRLRAMEDVRQRIRQSQLPSEEWVKLDQTLREIRQRCSQLDAEFREAQTQRHRLERIQHAIPLVAVRNELRGQLASRRGTPRLPAGFAERRSKAAEQWAVAQQAALAAKANLEGFDRDLAAIVLPESLLAQESAIALLPDMVGAHRKAQNDLPGIDARRQESRRLIASILREVRPGLSVDLADQLLLTVAQRELILGLVAEHSGVVQKAASSRLRVEKLDRKLASLAASMAQSEPPPDVALLKDAVRRVQSQGNLDAELLQARAELSRLEKQASLGMKKLAGWSGTLEALESAPLPAQATIDRFEVELRQLGERIDRLGVQRDEIRTRQSDLARGLEELSLQGGVPSEEELAAVRGRRDRGWKLVLQRLDRADVDAAERDAFVAGVDGAKDLPSAYEATVREADETADRLRREANRVAQWATIVAEQRAVEKAAAQLERESADATQARQRAESEWNACWTPAGVEPRWPQEMRAWRVQADEVLRRAESVRQQQSVVERLERQFAQSRDWLQGAMPANAAPSASDVGLLEALLGRCESLCADADGIAASRNALVQEIERLKAERASAEAELQETEREIEAWTSRWSVAIEPIGLSSDATTNVVSQVLERLQTLAGKLELLASDAERIEGIEREAKRFADLARDLAERAAPDLVDRPCVEAAAELIERLARAHRERDRVADLTARRRRSEADHQRHSESVRSLQAQLMAMCQEAGCAAIEELPAIEQAASDVVAFEKRLAEVETQLIALAAGTPLDEFGVFVETHSADDLPGLLLQSNERIERIDADRGALKEEIGAKNELLGSMNTNADAAEAVAEHQDLLARLESEGSQYVRLRLAGAVLREGIERYRKKNEGSVLRRAGELFQRFTRGAFAGLAVDVDGEGQSVLVGMRPGADRRVELAGMSEGTADQLYLALRLASLESYMDGKEPMPFIVDDILVTFDDGRAAASLAVLAEFSRRTQVIFFTHHQHLVELARQSAASDVFVHDLSAAVC
jgi:uncharacterized protein YhaN